MFASHCLCCSASKDFTPFSPQQTVRLPICAEFNMIFQQLFAFELGEEKNFSIFARVIEWNRTVGTDDFS